MTIQNIALFEALGTKMDYLNQRQRVISQNIANADSPGYVPKDLKKVDFGRLLKNIGASSGSMGLRTTSDTHMPDVDIAQAYKSDEQKKTYEVAPAGNAVIMEEQVIASNETMMDYSLMTSLYEKNVRMLRTAIGSQ